MKIIALGDLHGLSKWKQIVENETYDKVIILGDMFDSFDIKSDDIHANFMDIVEFKRSQPDKVVLLLGNHELNYLSHGQKCSGYRPETKVCMSHILDELVKNGEMKVCHKEDDVIYTHAGVTKTWCDDNGIDIDDTIDTQINELFLRNYKPFIFQSRSFRTSPYGDDVFQSPLWIRPYSLKEDKIDGFRQVVGHTPKRTVTIEDNIAFTDCLEHGDGSYLVIENGEFKINKL